MRGSGSCAGFSAEFLRSGSRACWASHCGRRRDRKLLPRSRRRRLLRSTALPSRCRRLTWPNSSSPGYRPVSDCWDRSIHLFRASAIRPLELRTNSNLLTRFCRSTAPRIRRSNHSLISFGKHGVIRTLLARDGAGSVVAAVRQSLRNPILVFLLPADRRPLCPL